MRVQKTPTGLAMGVGVAHLWKSQVRLQIGTLTF